ncbi:hypothetical protein OG871_16305 [Kitasatospora sp. NBC_00374]|uniref:hypothetical protein n=1 Tax=Kitasatospora sp. NBC_00374 TaxID=2975964 RepID=UPI0030E57B38
MSASPPTPPHPHGTGPDTASIRRDPVCAGPDGGLALGLLVLALDVWLAGLAVLLLLLSGAGHPFPWIEYPPSGAPLADRPHTGHTPALVAAGTGAILALSALLLALRRHRGAAAVQLVLLAGVLAVTLMAR